MIFERVVCGQPSNSSAELLSCEMKHISRKNLRIDFQINLTEPVHDIWVHTVFYHKYNTYQKFPIDLWENVCDWLAGKSKSYVLDWTIGRVRRFANLNHPCPYEGLVYLKINNVSIDKFPIEPLLPSGRYRMDVNFTEGNRKKTYVESKFFFSISDHRIEQY